MSFPNKDQMKNHIKRMHLPRFFNCHICKLELESKKLLKAHIFYEHGEGGYGCDEHCGKIFTRKKYLIAHLAIVTEKEQLCMNKLCLFDEDSCEEANSAMWQTVVNRVMQALILKQEESSKI